MISDTQISPISSGLTPQQIVQTYSAEGWETFIEEWADGFDPPYAQVIRLAGPGDKGRDIVAHLGPPEDGPSPWDNYQCKHYDHALRPTDVYKELGKLCFHCFEGAYTKPRRYRFVAPFGVGIKLYDLMRDPNSLRIALVANWEKHVAGEITETGSIPLQGGLSEYVMEFDFQIVWFVTPAEIIAQHRRTPHWHRRFRFDPPVRPNVPPIPPDMQPHELGYVSSLLEAYADHLGRPIASVEDLSNETRLIRHLRRSREYFFSAEALGRFSRDNFAPRSFETVKRHVYDGVADVVDYDFPDGLARVQKVMETAVGVQLPESELKPYLEPGDRKGLCHHLANDGELRWCVDEK